MPARATPAATRHYDEHRLAEVSGGGGEHRPSMGQDMVKGRRTEIEFLNGMVAKKGDEIGIATPANVVLTDIVKRVERGDLKPDPQAHHGSAAELTGAVAPVHVTGAAGASGCCRSPSFPGTPEESRRRSASWPSPVPARSRTPPVSATGAYRDR